MRRTYTIATTQSFNDNLPTFQRKVLELANIVRGGSLQSYNVKKDSVTAKILAGVDGYRYSVVFTLTESQFTFEISTRCQTASLDSSFDWYVNEFQNCRTSHFVGSKVTCF